MTKTAKRLRKNNTKKMKGGGFWGDLLQKYNLFKKNDQAPVTTPTTPTTPTPPQPTQPPTPTQPTPYTAPTTAPYTQQPLNGGRRRKTNKATRKAKKGGRMAKKGARKTNKSRRTRK